jgi:ACT domain-containing protein
LKPSQLSALERLYRRRVAPCDLITQELGSRMAELSEETGRQIGVLINRIGLVEYVIVGDVSAAEMKRITDGIQALGQVESIDVKYSISSSKDKAAHISGKVRDRDIIKKSNRFMRERAKRSGFVIIRGFGD